MSSDWYVYIRLTIRCYKYKKHHDGRSNTRKYCKFGV